MKKQIRMALWIGLAFLSLLLQSKLSVFGFSPNLSIGIVYIYAARALAAQSGDAGFTNVTAEISAASYGAFVGILEDLISGVLPGVNFMSKSLLGLLIVIIFRDYISQWTPAIGAIVIAVITMLDGAIVVGVSQLAMDIDINEYSAALMILIQAAANIFIGFIFRFGHKISDIKGL